MIIKNLSLQELEKSFLVADRIESIVANAFVEEVKNMQAIKPPGEFKDDITGIATFLYKLNLLGAHLFFTEFNIGVIFNAISLNGTLQRFLLSVVNRAVSNLIISHLYDEWFETIFEAYKYHADVSSSKFNLISPELKSSTSPSVIEEEEAKENPLIFVLYYFVAKGFSGLIEEACMPTEKPPVKQ